MAFAAVVFDLDGTLLNTIPDLTDATNAMRTQLALPPLQQDVIATYVGQGIETLIRRALTHDFGTTPDPGLLAQGLELFGARYHLVNGDKTQIYSGVIEGLREFRAQGLKMAVVTNKSTEFTLPLLERMGLAGFFDHVVCGDTCARKKPDPMPMLHACDLLGVSPADTLVVGDSSNDVRAGRAAGMRVVIVPYGFNEGRDVQELDVDDIVATVYDAALWARQQA